MKLKLPEPNTELQRLPNIDLTRLFAQLDPHTRRAYRAGILQFARWLVSQGHIRDEQDNDALLASAGEFLFSRHPAEANILAIEWFRYMLEEGPDGLPMYARGTVANRRSALLWACRCARQLGRINWHLDAPLPKTVKDKDGKPAYKPGRDMRGPTFEEVQVLWQHLEGVSGAKGGLMRAITGLILFETLREHEIRQLDLKDFRGGSLYVVRKKRAEQERIVLSKASKRYLEEWLQYRGKKPGPLFTRLDVPGLVRIGKTRIFDMLRNLGEELGFGRPLSPHRLRHTAITLGEAAAQEAGISTAVRMKRSGHKNPSVYLRYVDDTEDEAGVLSDKVAEIVTSSRS